MKIKKNILFLSIVVAIGALLRFWGIGFGPYHPDEPLVINQALAFGTGNLIPWLYYYPPFFHYILFLLYGLLFVGGWIIGPFRVFDNFLYLVLIEKIPFYIIGRAAVALIGTATIAAVYKIAKGLRSERAGLLAAIFIAFAFLHVRNSHYCTVDVPVTFLITVAYIFILRVVMTNNIRDYLYAGIFTGLAISTKYNAGVLIFCTGMAALSKLSIKKGSFGNFQIIRNLALSYISTIVIVLIFCSYIITDFPGFIRAMGVLRDIGSGMNISTWYRLRVDLFYGLGPPLELFGLLGLIYLAFRRKKEGLILALFPVLYLACIRKVGQPFARYSLLLVPFFAVSAGIFLDLIISRLRVSPFFKAALATLIVIILIFNPCMKSIYADYLLTKPDLRDLAGKWIYENIPAGSKIAIDNSQYAPHLYSTKEQLKDQLESIKKGNKGLAIKQKRLGMLIDLKRYPSPSYQLYYFTLEPAEFSLHMPAISYTRESLLKNDIEYIVTNFFSMRRYAEFYKDIKDILVPVKRFYPFKNREKGYSKYEYSYMPLDGSLFDLANNGTGVTIYRLKR